MKKRLNWKQKIGISVLGFFLLIGVFVGSVILNGTCAKRFKVSDQNKGTTWMSRLDDEILLNEVKMPGSHDSGTYGMNWLSECQQFDVSEQLELGCRYFDIRVKKINEEEHRLYHGPFNGDYIENAIDNFVSFLTNNQSETLLLDFQHFENGAESYVFDLVNAKLLPFSVKNETEKSDLEFISSLKMKDVRGKCVIFFGYGIHKEMNYIFERNNDSCSKEGCCLDSRYDTDRNSVSSAEFIEKTIPFYIESIKSKIGKETHKGIFVLQGQLTDGMLIFGPYSREKTHKRKMMKFIDSLKEKDYFPLINVVLRDFVDEKKCSQIYELNFINE